MEVGKLGEIIDGAGDGGSGWQVPELSRGEWRESVAGLERWTVRRPLIYQVSGACSFWWTCSGLAAPPLAGPVVPSDAKQRRDQWGLGRELDRDGRQREA